MPPIHPLNLTAKLKDAANVSAPELSFQRKAVQDFDSRQANLSQPSHPAESDNRPASSALNSHLFVRSTDTAPAPQNKPTIAVDSDAEDADSPRQKGKKRATLGNPVAVDADGLLMDVDVQSIDDNPPTREDKRQDVDQFFRPAVVRNVNGKSKKYRACKLCPNNKSLVNEVTTLRRHLEANHSGKYRNWAKSVNFLSKLPGDIKKRKEGVEEVTRTLDRDLREKKISERAVPYSHKDFCRAAVEWLVATDQPLQAFEHPKFKSMIDIASRAPNGVVKIPDISEKEYKTRKLDMRKASKREVREAEL